MGLDPSHTQMGQSVGARIRAARQAKKYTQSQLASPDFSVSYISAIERGQIHPSLRALEILARHLDLSSTQLLMEHSPEGNGAFTSSSIQEETVIELELLEAQVSILQGVALEAIAQLEKLTSKNLQNWHQTQHRYLLGWAYLQIAQLQKCEDALAEAEKLAHTQNDTYRSLHIYNLLGLAYSAMHNHRRALESHQTCLKLLESAQPQDPFFLCHVYSHLGQHYSHLNDFTSAIDMFKQAIEFADQLAVLEHTKSIYWNICQHYASTADNYLATLYAHKCLHLYAQKVHSPLRSEIYYYLGRAMMKGDQEKARAYLEEALQQKNNLQDPLAQASITTRLAEWFLVHNAPQEAERQVKRAFELARPFGDTLIAVEALLTWGRIRYALAKYREGDKHFVAGLDMLERLENFEELADQSALYARLLDEQNKTHEAITYYKRAFESHQRIRW